MDLWTANEREFRVYVEEHHWDDIDPEVPLLKPSAAEVRIGALILDLVARNKAGGLTLVEFKVKASKDTLAQLLLYPRAFEKALRAAGCPEVPKLRVVLVSPFIDRGVVELAGKIQPPHPIHIRLCVPDGDQRIKLMSPNEPGVPEQHCWEQSEVAGRSSQVGWDKDGGLLIRGQRLVAV
ncbi:hypothetical protein [Archangium sp.]|uniref:hypothetical protein n=1 Tax=Archangium sp. TaxID=1872627 RepID=UPI00389A7EDD